MKVLIVDDEAPARARLQAMLESIDGYSSCGDAANGTEALALAEAGVLTDDEIAER